MAFYCDSDVDAMGMSFAVCCPSSVFPTVSFASPYFSASVYNPVYQPIYQPLYNPIYTSTPIYTTIGF